MNASTGRGRLVAVFLAGAALLVAGCSTSNASAGPTISGTPQASSSGQVTTSPSASPSTSTGLASCKNGVLSVLIAKIKPTRGAATYRIEFKNLSPTSCTLYGFPGVAFFGANDSVQVGPAATMNHGSPEHLVGLPTQGTAIAQLTMANAEKYPSRCHRTAVSGIVVTPPGLTKSVRLPLSGLTCTNRKYHVLTVNAVVQGPPPPGGD
jgi:hypothetical protein